MIAQLLFAAMLVTAGVFFARQVGAIRRNIQKGMDTHRNDRRPDRIRRMLLVAFGQQKMFKKLTPAVLHAFVYVGFLVINIELIEIVIDGLTGTHRVLSFLGPGYDALMAINETLGFLVIIACIILFWRRNVMKVKRFTGVEMSRFPRLDANIILVTEVILMKALFWFNAADIALANMHGESLPGVFPVSSLYAGHLPQDEALLTFMRAAGWWIHIAGILAFLNYIPRSKHLHIIMAFPNTFFSKLEPVGKIANMEPITHEVKGMLDPSYQPPAGHQAPMRFGAKDIMDLTWKQLMDAYACTECGRCTDQCPANITGKLLSPRKLIMDTRDRMEMLQHANGSEELAAKTLLDHQITREELLACTTCNACVEACPVNIDHVSTVVEMRRYLIMEESAAPQEWNIMFQNIENNGAPWAMPSSARFDWAQDISVPA